MRDYRIRKTAALALAALASSCSTSTLRDGESRSPASANGCPQIFRLEEPADPLPGRTDLLKRLPAIHLTKFFPETGSIRAVTEGRGRFGATIHFSLGQPVIDHIFGKWDQAPYGILMPFEAVIGQSINIHPQDTFTIGDVRLPKDAVVFVPEGDSHAPSGYPFKIVRYSKERGIKNAIREYLRASALLELKATSAWGREPIYFGNIHINEDGENGLRRFFEPALGVGKSMRYGSHEDHPSGVLDDLVIDIVTRWGEQAKPIEGDLHGVKLMRLRAKDSLRALDLEVARLNLSEEAGRSYHGEAKPVIERLMNVLDAEIRLRQESGKSFLKMGPESDPSLRRKILQAASDPTALWEALEQNVERLASSTGYSSPYRVEQFLGALRFTEDLAVFKSDLREILGLGPSATNDVFDGATFTKTLRLLARGKIDPREAVAETIRTERFLADLRFTNDFYECMTALALSEPPDAGLLAYFRDPRIRELVEKHAGPYSRYEPGKYAAFQARVQ